MKKGDPYFRFVDLEDALYIGFCPDLSVGGCCHGNDPVQVYAELCGLVEGDVGDRERAGRPLPEAKIRPLATAAV